MDNGVEMNIKDDIKLCLVPFMIITAIPFVFTLSVIEYAYDYITTRGMMIKHGK